MATFKARKWNLYDESGIVRRQIEEPELFRLLCTNAEEGSSVYVVNEEGTRRVQLTMHEIAPES